MGGVCKALEIWSPLEFLQNFYELVKSICRAIRKVYHVEMRHHDQANSHSGWTHVPVLGATWSHMHKNINFSTFIWWASFSYSISHVACSSFGVTSLPHDVMAMCTCDPMFARDCCLCGIFHMWSPQRPIITFVMLLILNQSLSLWPSIILALKKLRRKDQKLFRAVNFLKVTDSKVLLQPWECVW